MLLGICLVGCRHHASWLTVVQPKLHLPPCLKRCAMPDTIECRGAGLNDTLCSTTRRVYNIIPSTYLQYRKSQDSPKSQDSLYQPSWPASFRLSLCPAISKVEADHRKQPKTNVSMSRKWCVPDSRYSRVPPKAYRSDAGCAAPLNCSGAMYP